jgi:hypothetical protein
MKRLPELLIRFYPKAWRVRYGAEMAALLEDANATPSTAFNLLKGALRMQLSVRSFPRLALVLSAAGILVGLVASYMVNPRYIASATMVLTDVGNNPAPHPPLQIVLLQLQQETLSRTSLQRIIQNPRLDLYHHEQTGLPLEDIIENMRKHDIRITPVKEPVANIPGASSTLLPFEITFSYPDARKARKVVQALIMNFADSNLQRGLHAKASSARIDEFAQLNARVAALEHKLGLPSEPTRAPALAWSINLEVLDPPSLPELPAWPDRAAFAATGFAVGIFLALLITLIRMTRQPLPAPASLA